jgi:nucleoside-diphosphate-sugar epimerase
VAAVTRRVLITGSSGFVGGALGAWLRRHTGTTVVGLSRSPPRPGACDFHIRHDLTQPMPDTVGPCDVVVHCAALASPWAAPRDYEAANIVALRNILAWAEAKAVPHFVFISSSAVQYAFADQLNLAEDTPWPEHPINLYAASKRRGEAMVAATSLNWTIVRPRAVYGPGDTVVFPRILHAARKGVLPRLRRQDRQVPSIDLLYIDNLCWFVERILDGGHGGVFNLADGQPMETPALLMTVLGRLGLPEPRLELSVGAAMAMAGVFEFASRWLQNWREPPVTKFGVASLAYSKTIDTRKATGLLGVPPVSLEDGLDAFLQWQAEQMRSE